MKPRPAKTRIDAHQHFWRFDPRRDTWIDGSMSALRRDFMPQDLALHLRRNRMDASIAVQASQSENETRFLLKLANQCPFIVAVVGWTDLCAPDLGRRLEYFSRFEKLRGFRHIVQSEPDDYLSRQIVVRGIASLAEFGFTFDLLVYPRQLPAALDLVNRLPDQRFILDHIAKPAIKTREIAGWAASIRDIARNPSVCCKISGLITEADWTNWRADDFRPYLDVVFEAFGPERLVFGSDWPVCLLAGTYDQVVGLIADYLRGRPPLEQEKIFGSNAARFYALDTHARGVQRKQGSAA